MAGTDGTVEAYFNRPGRPFSLDQLERDIRGAKQEVIMASAWLTLRSIPFAIAESVAKKKLILLNASDLKRSQGAGAKILKTLWGEQEREHSLGRYLQLVVLGGKDYKEGIMHHKVVVVDRKIVWLGSYNFTYQAAKNYENLLRIEHAGTAEAYAVELADIADHDTALWNYSAAYYDKPTGAFRCDECGKIFNDSELGYKDATHPPICRKCMKLDAEGGWWDSHTGGV